VFHDIPLKAQTKRYIL